MTWTLKISIALACFLFIYLQASQQAKVFRRQKTISHFAKGMWYFLFVMLLTSIMMWGRWHNWKHEDRLWGIPLIGLCTRIAWFDLLLCYKMAWKWYYNGTNLGHSKGSLIDRWENELSIGAVKAIKLFYIAAFILTLIFT